MKVKDKKIIVTGGGAGIGREIVLQLLSMGAHVIALDISESGLEETKKLANNDSLFTYVLDMGNYDSLKKFKEEYYNKYDSVDGLINNAGIIQPFVNVSELEDKTIDKIMDVNFYGPVNLTRLFLKELLTRPEGHIVNVSSMGGFFPFPGQTIYGASKAGLKLFTEGLYSELLGTKVGVTVVFPGAIATDIAKNSNVTISMEKTKKEDTSKPQMQMTSASEAARQIIEGMENNEFQVFVGKDSKMMNLMYKFMPKKAIKFINEKMKNM